VFFYFCAVVFPLCVGITSLFVFEVGVFLFLQGRLVVLLHVCGIIFFTIQSERAASYKFIVFML